MYVISAIMVLLFFLFYAVNGYACVDCDLNKKVFEKEPPVLEIEWHNPDGTVQRSTKVVDGSKKILYDNVKPVYNDAGQYCYIKIIIKQSANGDISKEEKLYCSDGKQGIDTPSYWELFAQFYYREMGPPPYCRYYSRKKHAFKSYGKVCLNEYGKWEVK